ncbi:hypothetical protein [Paractinoplanes toevensis]|uniref:Uncharacterized protein n=1 Tax=Paractinoplanes toevensis TaxID=571911 RepID=A0A919W6Q3_9ACTN|nr:hypothetical protein [Actinoplanes toevensis]GIM93393.1 hypothetical protein Ato02nite_051860 [Actinoplanes toevensis]
MPDVTPGDSTYDETIRRIAQLIQSDENERGKIQELSTESFREWLDDIVRRISRELGIALANVHVLIEDVFTIGLNAATSFAGGYRDAYQKARRVQRLR